MNYKEHLTWGAIILTITSITFILLAYFTDYIGFIKVFEFYAWYIPTLLIAFLLGLYASILPDVDIGTSKAFSLTYIFLILLILYSIFVIPNIMITAACLILMIVIMTFKHRGITHEWYSAFIIGALFSWLFGLSLLIFIFVTIGYLTHLACDR